jgi:hypothetical protein
VDRLKRGHDRERGLQGGKGKTQVLEGKEAVEQLIIDALTGLRKSGQPMNAALMQSVNKGIVQEEAPHLF